MCTCPNYMLWRGDWTKNDRPDYQFVGHHQYNRLLEYFKDVPFIEVPCGKCLECRIQYTRTWSDRCVLEAKHHKYNYFITLTYDDECLPPNGSLEPKDMTLFIKRLRKRFKKHTIRFLYCGEYSPALRPHYHMIMFSDVPLSDLSYEFYKLDKESGRFVKHIRPPSKKNTIMHSMTIYKLWQYKGIISVDNFNYDTAAYVAQYVTKKCNPKMDETFKSLGLYPEFLRMSTKPGIGAEYFETHDDLHFNGKLAIPSDGCAHLVSVPRYFDKLFQKKFGEDVFDDKIRSKRIYDRIKGIDTYLASGRDKDGEAKIKDYNLRLIQRKKNLL